jgi:hypothetical protein
MEVNKATFTFDSKPELLVGGKKRAFEAMELPGGKKIGGVTLKDGTIARLKRLDDGKFEVTLMAASGKDLSNRKVRIGEGGVLSRLRSTEGEKYDLTDTDNQKLVSGRTLKLNAKTVADLTKGVEALGEKIQLRVSPEPKKKKTEKDGDQDQTKPLTQARRDNPIVSKPEDQTKPLDQARRNNPIVSKPEDQTKPLDQARRDNPIVSKPEDQTKPLDQARRDNPIVSEPPGGQT